MSWVGFEPTIAASERAKTVYALDRSATVTGKRDVYMQWINIQVNTVWIMEKNGQIDPLNSAATGEVLI
jgi:hypothetical protein